MSQRLLITTNWLIRTASAHMSLSQSCDDRLYLSGVKQIPHLAILIAKQTKTHCNWYGVAQ